MLTKLGECGIILLRETRLYYLQSRYYDPKVGRFVNADDAILIANRTQKEFNIFTYCVNNPINRCDRLGFASYHNTKSKKEKEVYVITSVISGWWTKLTYKYKVDKGVIRFVFDENNYWEALWRGWAKTLAEAMYKAAKSINKSYLQGRTITGLHTELFIHWALYKMGIKTDSTNRADMGGCRGVGYDDNAWFFETVNVISRALSINVFGLWAWISLLRDLARYL